MDVNENQMLSEMRKLNSKFDDLSLQIRIDTPWQRIRDNIKYGVNMIKEIPIASRLLLFSATCLMTASIVFSVTPEIKKKLMMFALDCVSLAMVLIWT